MLTPWKESYDQPLSRAVKNLLSAWVCAATWGATILEVTQSRRRGTGVCWRGLSDGSRVCESGKAVPRSHERTRVFVQVDMRVWCKGALLYVTGQPGRKGLGRKWTHGRVPLLVTWTYHDIGSQLYPKQKETRGCGQRSSAWRRPAELPHPACCRGAAGQSPFNARGAAAATAQGPRVRRQT